MENYSYNPWFMVDPWRKDTKNKEIPAPATKVVAEKLKALHEDLTEAIKVVQNYQAQYYNAKHQLIQFQKGNRVWLQSVNVHIERQSQKLDWKRLRPFTIIECISI